jgi:hypothetical protein
MVRKIFYGVKLMFMITRYMFRFFVGRPMSGERKTDATFWHPATRSLDPSGKALRWEMQRGAARAAWRIGALYVLLLLSASSLLWVGGRFTELPPQLRPSFLLLLHLSVVSVVGVSLLAKRRMRDYGYSLPVLRREEAPDGTEHLRLRSYVVEGRKAWLEEKILPLTRSTSVILGHHIPERKATDWITVPKDYREPGGAPVEIRLPPAFTGADKGVQARLLSSVSRKLGMENVSATWQLEGASPRVLISSPPDPPKLISFSDVEHYLSAMGEWDFFYGVIGTGEAFSVSISGDTPHGAVSAGSGAGKSELLKGKVMQAGHKGWFTIVMDWKEESQEWVKGLHGTRYVSSVEKIHDMCVALGDEVEWRKAHPGAPRARVLVLAEEWSITAPLLTEYWSSLRSMADPEDKKRMPLRSPAITSIMKVIFAGRSLGIFLELVAIRFSARVTNGNADLRESFQVIHMARWKSQTVKMLAPDIKPFPRKPKDPGRWVAVNGDVAVIYQAPLYSDAEAVSWHQSGLEIPMSPWCERRPNSEILDDVSPTQGIELGPDLTDLALDLPVLEASEAPLSVRKLTDMVDALEHLGVTLNVLRKAAKEDPAFPPVVSGSQFKGYEYDLYAVKEWAMRRKAARKVESEARK